MYAILICAIVSCIHARKVVTKKVDEAFSPSLYGFEHDTLCQELLKDIKAYWRYDSMKKVYKVNQILVTKITNDVYSDCFKRMDTTQCKRLLGKDSGQSPIQLQYFLNTACNENTFETCYYICFRYDRTGKIVRAGYCAASGNK